MNTKNANEQVVMDLPMEETTTDIKKKKTTKKEPAKKVMEGTMEEVEKKVISKAKSSKSEASDDVKETKVKAKKVVKSTANLDAKDTSTVAKKKAPAKKVTAKKAATKAVKKEEATTEEGSQVVEKTMSKSKASRTITKDKIKQKEKSKVQLESDTVMLDSNKIDEEQTASSNEPIVEDIKRFKLFFVSDMDDEANYLHEMSLQGYHFVTKKGMQYIFRQGEPKNYYYHLGYYEKDKRDGERYLDNYIEAGWENIYHEKAEFDGVWNYFRIEMPINVEEPNIFSDRVSRLALYKRLLSSWRSLLAVDVLCFLALIFIYYSLSTHPSNMTGLFMTLCGLLFIIVLLVFIIYLRAYLKISKKQEELQNI